MSPDFAKNIRSLITRVNEKKPKSKKTSDYTPLTVKEGEEEEEEILATKATVESNTIKPETTTESNMANVDLQSYTTANSTANSTDLPVSREVARDPSTGPRIESIPPKAPSKSFTAQPIYEKSKPLIGQPSKALQLKADLVNLHGGVLYKSLGRKKQRTSITQKNRHNSAIPRPFHRDRIKLQTGYLATEYKQQLLAY
jgi:hypothetical protein